MTIDEAVEKFGIQVKATTFTTNEVTDLAHKIYGKSICTDFLKDAMKEPTLFDAADVLVLDSAYWNGDI